MNKLLIGSLVWCNEGWDDRASQQIAYLHQIQELKSSNDFDWLIVNNASTHPEINSYIEGLDATIITNSWNHGWAVGRNQMMQVFENSSSQVLAMMDSDLFYEDSYWPTKLVSAFDKCQWLIVCQIRTNTPEDVGRGDYEGSFVSPEGVVFNKHTHFYGTTNVINRKALSVFGGYDWKSIPGQWGYHDNEYGYRVAFSGLHPYGPYVDPVRLEKGFHDREGYSRMPTLITRNEWVIGLRRYYDAKMEYIRQGGSLFFDYHEMPCKGDFLE